MATVYVRDGASGSGSNWSDALDDLPGTMSAADTYYVAAGNYGSKTVIGTVLRATASSHGTETGWQASYAVGECVFTSPLILGGTGTLVDGQEWHGIRVTAGGLDDQGCLSLAGTNSTARYCWVEGTYGGAGDWGHSLSASGNNPTFDYCHTYKTRFEDSLRGQPTGTLTLTHCVFEQPGTQDLVPPRDTHWDLFNPYTASTAYNLTVEDCLVFDFPIDAFLMQDPGKMGAMIFRRCLFANVRGAYRYGSSNGGADSLLFDHCTYYNTSAYPAGTAGLTSVNTNNIYAKSAGWSNIWGSTVEPGGTLTNCLIVTDPTDFIDVTNVLGTDGNPFTALDGFNLVTGSSAIGGATDGSDIGAYQYSAASTDFAILSVNDGDVYDGKTMVITCENAGTTEGPVTYGDVPQDSGNVEWGDTQITVTDVDATGLTVGASHTLKCYKPV